MLCKECETELDFRQPEMTIVSDEHNQAILISCNSCGKTYEAIYSIDDVIDEKGDSIF